MKPEDFLNLGGFRINPDKIAWVEFDVDIAYHKDSTEWVDRVYFAYTIDEGTSYLQFPEGTFQSNDLRAYFGYQEPAE